MSSTRDRHILKKMAFAMYEYYTVRAANNEHSDQTVSKIGWLVPFLLTYSINIVQIYHSTLRSVKDHIYLSNTRDWHIVCHAQI